MIAWAFLLGVRSGFISAKVSGQGWVLAAAVLWGTTGTAQALAPAGAQPTAVGALRLAIGGGALLLLAVVRGAFANDQPWPKTAVFISALAMAAYQPLFFGGVARTGVAVGTIVTIGSSPVLAGLLGIVVRGERPSPRWVAATFLAVSGGALLVLAGGGLSVDVGGILLSLGAGLSYAMYAVASKGALEKQPPDAVTAVTFSLGALFLLPLLFTADLGWLAQPRGALVALHLGLLATAAAYALFSRGLQLVPTATAVTLSLAEPLTAGLLGVFLLGERLTPLAWLGILLLFTGLALLAAQKRLPEST